MTHTVKEIMTQAVLDRGAESQLNMLIEECAELIDAIQKYRRDRVSDKNIIEEAADVGLCIEQLLFMFDAHDLFDKIRLAKLERLESMIYREEVNHVAKQ